MISIIVPVYNVKNYLVPCVGSILNSTYRDFELILVDDGSTDGCGTICDEYASKDTRIQVIHKSNGGLSSARNEGLKVASGEYVGLVDGDDVIHPNMLQVLHSAITSGDYDLSMVYGEMVGEGAYAHYLADKSMGLTAGYRVLNKKEMFKGLMGPGGDDIPYMVAWNKLYKRSLLQGMVFNQTASEDLEWNTRVCMKMNKAVLVDAKMYYWVQRSASITHQRVNLNTIDRINSYQLALNAIPLEMKEERAMCLEKLYKVILHTRYNATGSNFSNKAKTLGRSAYKATIQEYLQSEISWPMKCFLLLFYHMPWLYGLFLRVSHSGKA